MRIFLILLLVGVFCGALPTLAQHTFDVKDLRAYDNPYRLTPSKILVNYSDTDYKPSRRLPAWKKMKVIIC